MLDVKKLLTKILNSIISDMGSRYVQFSNGLQICWLSTTASMAVDTAYGSIYIHNFNWTFAKPFVQEPAVAVGRAQWGTSASWGTVAGISATSTDIRVMDFFQRTTGSTYITAIAIGRWK